MCMTAEKAVFGILVGVFEVAAVAAAGATDADSPLEEEGNPSSIISSLLLGDVETSSTKVAMVGGREV